MAQDNYAGQSNAIAAPSEDFALIVPDDDVDLPVLPKWVFCGTGGTVSIHNRLGVVVTFVAVDGQFLPIRPRRVLEATTAQLIAGY